MRHRTHRSCYTNCCTEDNQDEQPVHKCVFQIVADSGVPLAKALNMPKPIGPDIDYSNCKWNTSKFGTLQMCQLPCSLMKSIYEIGRRSTPYCHNLCVERQVSPELADLAKQHIDDGKDLHIWKTPDGYLLTDKDTNVFALVHAKGFHYHDTNPNKCTGKGHMLIVAHPPNQPCPTPFKAVLHNDICGPHEISRMGTIEHSMRKMLSAVVYTDTPRVVYTSPLGEMVARILKAQSAILVKSCFVKMASEEGSDMFDTRLELHPDLANLLMLKSNTGNLRCVPCANGYIGYRVQTADPTKRTLVLLANSSDTGADSVQTGNDSDLQIFKFNYADCNGSERFIVQPTAADCNDPYDIACTDTVQEILNRVEKVFRDSVSWGSKLHPFEVGANITCNLPESSRFIDPNVKQTESNKLIQNFFMQYMAHMHDIGGDFGGMAAAAA